MNEQFQPVVDLIVAKSPSTAPEALKVLRSSAPLLRLRAIAPNALTEGTWTEEERLLLLDTLNSDRDEDGGDSTQSGRTKTLAIRLTEDEHKQLFSMAKENGVSVSDFIRVNLGL